MATEQTWVPLTEQVRKALQTGAEGQREAGLELGRGQFALGGGQLP